MTYQETEKLLQKYNQAYVPGEKRSSTYDKQIKKEGLFKYRITILEQINQDLPYSIKPNKHELEIIISILRTFNKDLKYLHRQASNEAIILAIIYTIKKRVHPNLDIEKYNIFQKHGLTYPILCTILSRLTNYYILTSPIIIHETCKYDQEILYKHHFRQ